jgi:crotonobetainyl-CoA:carnitine CoA-transferase CaiB-like acyl-CoA transferase
MYDILTGVRVVEVGSFVFVPLAAAILADWGAEVIKVEHPVTGDPYRGLMTAGFTSTVDGIDLSFQYANRGKRSIGLDLSRERGRALLAELVGRADVFMTNQRPEARARLSIEVADIRAVNPNVVYVRGSGYGQKGPLAETAALDSTAYWARGGVSGVLTPPGAQWPLNQRPAFGDVMAAMTLAGGVAAALYRRAASGKGCVVDVGLLNVGMWQVQRDILGAQFAAPSAPPPAVGRGQRNPLTETYRTKDGRFITLAVLNPDAYWTEFCNVIGKPKLLADERFSDMAVRNRHARECVALLDEVFGSETFEHWRRVLAGFSGAWAPVQVPADLYTDEQALQNGFFTELDTGRDRTFRVVSSPVTFDERDATRRVPAAPAVGQHTEEILLELSYSWDDIAKLKDAGVVN